MSNAVNKGRITCTTETSGGGVSYIRVQPGVTLPSELLTPAQVTALSGPVTTYKKGVSDDGKKL